MRFGSGRSLAVIVVFVVLICIALGLSAVFFIRSLPEQHQHNDHSSTTLSSSTLQDEAVSDKLNVVDAKVETEPSKTEELVRPLKLWPKPSEHSYPGEYQPTPEELRNQHTGHYRGKTAKLWDPHPRYEFKAFGKTFLLELKPSAPVVLPNIKILHVWDNVSRAEEPKVNTRGCMYTGHVVGDDNSVVSVSLCHGMRGHIWTSTGSYTIEPVEKWKGPDENLLHVIRKPPELHHSCHHEDDMHSHGHPYEDIVPQFVHNPQSKRRKRSSNREYTIELMVVADKKVKEFHGDDLDHYIINLVAAADKILKDPSIGNPMGVVLVRVIVFEKMEWAGFLASRMLNEFCDWQFRMNTPDDSDVLHHDAAIFLTREKLCRPTNCESIGLAEVGGICKNGSYLGCAIVKDIGLSTVFTIAHELGHVLSLQHDNASEGSKCYKYLRRSDRPYLMATVLSSDTNPWSWSECSRHLLTEFLEEGHGFCLLDQPVVDLVNNMEGDQKPLGENYDLDKQCALTYGKGYRLCPQYSSCHELWCQNNSSDICSTVHAPWADGTPCGEGKWCQKRKCVSKKFLKPVHGGWSEWQSSGECSRSCGGGVGKSVRECNNPSPLNGGKYCVGERVRYHSCSTQECPPGSMDFRDKQCAIFNGDNFNLSVLSNNVKWFPKHDGISSEERCKLYCRNTETVHHYELSEKVIDGTLCGPDTFDICVNGLCLPAGCDHVLHSKKKLDYCGQCGGDNSTCKVISNTYNNTNYGYKSIDTIPAGASYLDVRQHGYLNSNKDNNYLALYDNKTNQYILNGNYLVVPGRKLILYDGITTIEYSGKDAIVERIRLTGPLTKDLNLQVFSFGTPYPPDITFQYTISLNTLRNQFTWFLSDEWTPCDKVCNGATWQIYKCMRINDWKEFSEDLCSDFFKDKPRKKPCNEHCSIEWQVVSKSDCSSDCDNGYREVFYKCFIYENDMSTPTQDSACSHLPRPSDKEPCTGQCMGPRWIFSVWSVCSHSCGGGIRTREAYCMSHKQKRDESECIMSKKKTKEVCNTQECPTWQVGEWTECSVTCGGGKRHRQYKCQYDGNEVSYENCSLPLPVITENCNVKPCPYWKAEEWSECSVSCGKGEQVRKVVCSTPNDCKNSTKPITTKPCLRSECSLGHANAIPGDSSIRFRWKQKWSECSVSCGKGETRSSVECYDNIIEKATDFRNCAHQEFPSYGNIEICYMPPCPRWVIGDWEPCSAICGTGTHSKRIYCESHNGITLSDYKCPIHTKPPREERYCNVDCQHSSYFSNEWIKMNWSPCSVSCGTGIMVREVRCEGFCPGKKPRMSAPCDAGPCPEEGFWNTGSWSQCSVSCGEGVQERQVQCQSRKGEKLSDSQCSDPMPSYRQLCKAGPCKPVYKWEVTRWTPCSASCGKGTRRRQVECKSTRGEIVSVHHCLIVRKRPNDLKACKRAPCPFDWEEGEWSQCSSSCGTGIQYREVRCVKNNFSGKIRKSFVKVDERYCGMRIRPESRRTCKGYCNNKYRWETGVWQPCNKPCNRRGKQKRNLFCYNGKRKVSLANCPRELRPDRRRKCDTRQCPSCRDLQQGFNEKRDGEYQLYVQGRLVKVYCYNMQEYPKEYITLPSKNFAEIFSKSIRHPSRCLSRSQIPDYCENIPQHGFTAFHKIHINISTLVVDSTDWTFATTVNGNPVPYGEAGDCYTRGLCPQGQFNINLMTTGFRVSPMTAWVGLGEQHAPPSIDVIQDGQKVIGKCGGCCGFCKPRYGLKLDLLPP